MVDIVCWEELSGIVPYNKEDICKDLTKQCYLLV